MRAGHWKGYLFSPALTFTQGKIHLREGAGPPVPPLRVSDRMRVAFFLICFISFTCLPQPIELALASKPSPQEVKSIFIFG